jgi:ribosomal protein L37AE/L43A
VDKLAQEVVFVDMEPASERVKQHEICKRCEVLTAVRMSLVFWVVTLCGLEGT